MSKHTMRLFLMAAVVSGLGCRPGLDKATEGAVGAEIESPLLRQLDEQAPRQLAENDVPSLAVAYIRNGSVEWTKVYGEQSEGVQASTQTLYNVASLAKPVTAEIILRLAGSGRLSLDEPLSRHWIDPDVVGDPRHEKLTMRLALSHQTGFKNWRYQTDGVLRFDAEPGTIFGYSGEGYEYALRFTERKLGEKWASLATEYVFAPARMTNTAYTEQAWFAGRVAIPYEVEEGYLKPAMQTTPSAADDVYTTIGDYAAFLVSVMNREGLPAEIATQRDSLHVVNTNLTADCDPAHCPERAGIGLGWEILEFPHERVLLHTGGDSGTKTIAFYFAAERDGAVMFTNGGQGFQVIIPVIELLFPGTEFAGFAMSRR